MNILLLIISHFLPLREIMFEGRPYLERYYLFSIKGWNFYLHRFVASDPDRGLHDHPWKIAFSIVLSGYYLEHTRQGLKPVKWFNFLLGDNFHRVIMPEGRRYCWTLFFHKAENVKGWGFIKPIPMESVGRETNLENGFYYSPYNYNHEGGKPVNWWKTAPRGRKNAAKNRVKETNAT